MLSNTVRRAIAALVLLAFLTCCANQFFELHMFRRFDKAALSLCFVLMLVVVHFLKPDMPKQRPTFSWLQFYVIAAIIIGVSAWVAWDRHHSGLWEFGSASFLVVPGTLVIFL